MKKRREGFSLIEVMVALVILVIGLIGIFNLHIVAKRASFESFQQTQAAYFANDILNRMKLNNTVLNNYDDGSPYSGGGSAPAKSCDVALGATVTCTAAETLAWNLYQWQELFTGAAEAVGSQNVGGLDSATACLNVNGSNVTIVMAWRGIQETAGTAYETTDCGSSLGKRRRVFILKTVINQG
ncbi:type IV pilus modification protein PilV [Shewanella algae]|uniref:type IV pilus modification protein PilV n=1 Tax=Shewanella algae TaxID=38313 RepID=UPI000C347669|nr:type IV pilus modification protein PilV [Shewanella algae]MBO2642266.1 type IV pilus modification protein PilV [Shewanella algae]